MIKRGDGRYNVYVGSYAEENNQGIYWYVFDPDSCTMELVDSVSEIKNPSYLNIDKDQRFLYATSEVEESKTCEGGSVVSYSISRTAGKLLRLNEKLTLGDVPCYVSVGHDDQFLFIANYTGSSVSMFSVEEDGQIGELEDLVQHKGRSVNTDRQEKPHPHAAVLDAGHRFLFVPDLGMDQIRIYEINYESRKLIAHGKVDLPPGSGPRHLVIHENQKHAYCINELNGTVTAFAYDPVKAALEIVQTIKTLPNLDFEENSCAEIRIAPSGKFLYASNRQHSSITTYEIDEKTGLLAYVGFTPTGGRTPRNFALTPDGSFLLAANQDTHTIEAFEVDPATGGLTHKGTLAHVSQPNYLKIAIN
ncbi:MAG TPA: lactonase family protein [Bacilli bacterium]